MPVAVYGATGRTGGLVLSELGKHGVGCVVGGRDARRLAELEQRHPHVLGSRTADAGDPAALRAMLDGCDVVVNCVSPLARLGVAVVSAAIETGAHYVDPAGEQPFIREVFERHGRAAEKRGVALVPALGFDYAPGDCIARLAAQRHEPLRELVIAYALSGSATSRDAVLAAAPVNGGEVVYRDGGWAPVPGGVHRASFRFPPPLGRQRMQRYGSGEVITVPRHTRTRRVTSLITTSTWSPHPALTPLLPFVRPIAARVRRSPLQPVLALAAPAGDRDGSEEAGRTARFTIAAVAHGEDGSVGRGIVHGSDFDALTASVLARGAMRLSAGPRIAGAASPAVAFDPAELLDSLVDAGASWSAA
jgi:short subunit dehydrogenase-like uncharacterized protein